MRIVLINPLRGQSHGLKSISSFLKSQGHKVKLILLKSNLTNLIYKPGFIFRYDSGVINEVLNQCKGCNLVGITVMTNAFEPK